jgi:CheY-like chemotaxis protein
LAGGIAHDFNNLLSVVLGYADLSLSRVADDDALRRFLEQIHRAAIRASELTQQLLAFGRRQVLKPELLDLKYRVSEADGPRSALRLAETCGTIDLLLSDVVMPDGGGRVLAEQLLAQRPGLRVLFMSGYTDDAVVKRGVLKAGVAFMQKPLTAKMLAARVREALSDLSPTIPSFE